MKSLLTTLKTLAVGTASAALVGAANGFVQYYYSSHGVINWHSLGVSAGISALLTAAIYLKQSPLLPSGFKVPQGFKLVKE